MPNHYYRWRTSGDDTSNHIRDERDLAQLSAELRREGYVISEAFRMLETMRNRPSSPAELRTPPPFFVMEVLGPVALFAPPLVELLELVVPPGLEVEVLPARY